MSDLDIQSLVRIGRAGLRDIALGISLPWCWLGQLKGCYKASETSMGFHDCVTVCMGCVS